MKMKKILAVLIISVMTAAMFTSCTDDDEADGYENGGETISVEEDGLPPFELTVVPLWEEERIPTSLPDYDWDGYTLRILTDDMGRFGASYAVLNTRDIMAEELTGESFNDAVYHRNAVLEEKYNFTIEQVVVAHEEIIMNTVRRAVSAGDNYFDAISMTIAQSGMVARTGQLVDLFLINYIDFSKPWWDRGAVSELSVGNRLFFTSGDMLLLNFDLHPAILFNKPLCEDLRLPCPYELVRSGRWTIGRMYEMARTAAANLDGSGTMNPDTDRFGYIFDGLMSRFAFLHGMGVRWGGKDEDDLPVVFFGTERGFIAVQAHTDFGRADFFRDSPGIIGRDERSVSERAFAEDRGLFMGTAIVTVETLRGMDTDFGILPMPWLDEHQREWGHSVPTFSGQLLSVPNFHDVYALDRVGFMLEAISAESRYAILPVYYAIQLTGKLARDEESRDMLDIIFSSTVWDIGVVFDWFFNERGPLGYTASFFESRRGAVEAAVQRTIRDFERMD